MSELKVEVVKIEKIEKHANADRLDLATVFGYTVVVGRDQYSVDDCAVYFPVDSVIPTELADYIFADGKMDSVKRIRAARIRGVVSQGLLVDIPKIKKYYFKSEAEARGKVSWSVGMDLTSALGVTKHDPEKNKPACMKGNMSPKRDINPLFRKYTSIQHLKKYDECFDTGDPVWITEKIHGTNFRAGWVPTVARSAVDRFRVKLSKSKFALLRKLSLPEYTFVFGSHNVQVKPNSEDGYHGNVYEQCVLANDLKKKIPLGMVFYGEIFGPGIQKGYGYGLEDGAMDVRFFDVMHAATGKYVSFGDAIIYILGADQQVVPYHQGFYSKVNINHDLNTKRQKSYLDGKTDAEGLVIRSYSEDTFKGGRKIMKWISDAYLLKKNMSDYK